ncbi:MAG: hypothetical protein EA401_14195 [Planctomycetota bacterium]|nr:MAG: hypothetical protein EA401_14195 [Planctomycetota bacterium]
MSANDAPLAVAIDELQVPLGPLLNGPRQGLDQHLHEPIARLLGIAADDVLGYDLERRSIDARRKPDLIMCYRLHARVRPGAVVRESTGVRVATPPPNPAEALYHLPLSDQRPRQVVIVGTGPAGIMAAYLLALHGTQVLVLDRGYDVDRRHEHIETFHRDRILNPDSNYLYGEGGAGTYSDGKLYTRVKDRRMRFLLEAFVAARAPRHILWHHHPHIGSDILPHMARRLRQKIEEWGGSFRWGVEVSDILVEGGRCRGVRCADGSTIESDVTLIAPGHSARDLLRRLIAHNLEIKAKGFQLGCRVEHPQDIIDQGRYGVSLPRWLGGAAEYNLVSRPPPRSGIASTTTFCMCPGGEIIAATSDHGHLSTNGMSEHGRGSGMANAGLIVNQPIDRSLPAHEAALAGFALIDQLEAAAFQAGGGDYSCPAQTTTAFLRAEAGKPVERSSYRLGVVPGRIDRLLPTATSEALRAALRHYDKQVPGFARHGHLVGLETRVSSPLRFERRPDTLESTLSGLYLAGEGAGYAGGIVSAGLDGLRLAETMLTGVPQRREK